MNSSGHADRLFASCPEQRAIARELYQTVARLPLVSPHGHTDPRWFADNEAFANATELLIQPDHYLLRMLYSQGISLDALGIARSDGTRLDADPAAVWQIFADHYFLFRGTPTRLWMDYVFGEVFGIDEHFDSGSASQFN